MYIVFMAYPIAPKNYIIQHQKIKKKKSIEIFFGRWDIIIIIMKSKKKTTNKLWYQKILA